MQASCQFITLRIIIFRLSMNPQNAYHDMNTKATNISEFLQRCLLQTSSMESDINRLNFYVIAVHSPHMPALGRLVLRFHSQSIFNMQILPKQ